MPNNAMNRSRVGPTNLNSRDPELKSTRRYTNMSAAEVRQA